MYVCALYSHRRYVSVYETIRFRRRKKRRIHLRTNSRCCIKARYVSALCRISPQGKAYGQEVPLAGNNTQIVYIDTKAGVKNVQTNETELDCTINGNTICINNTQKVCRIDVYSIAGRKLFGTSNIANTINLPIQNGIYVVRIATTNGIITKKIAVK